MEHTLSICQFPCVHTSQNHVLCSVIFIYDDKTTMVCMKVTEEVPGSISAVGMEVFVFCRPCVVEWLVGGRVNAAVTCGRDTHGMEAHQLANSQT